MYILVEILHTEFQYISLIKCKSIIEIEKQLRKDKQKKWTFCPGAASATCLAHPFVPVGVTNRDKRVFFVPVARPGTKGHPLLPRPGVPGWETGTTGVSQPGQI